MYLVAYLDEFQKYTSHQHLVHGSNPGVNFNLLPTYPSFGATALGEPWLPLQPVSTKISISDY
jgi:hypothetical protein